MLVLENWKLSWYKFFLRFILKSRREKMYDITFSGRKKCKNAKIRSLMLIEEEKTYSWFCVYAVNFQCQTGAEWFKHLVYTISTALKVKMWKTWKDQTKKTTCIKVGTFPHNVFKSAHFFFFKLRRKGSLEQIPHYHCCLKADSLINIDITVSLS